MRLDGYFRLAKELGKHLHEVMGWPGPMTHRQFRYWMLWLELQWEYPDLNAHYQMATIREIRQFMYGIGGVKKTVKLEDCKLEFKREKPKSPGDKHKQTANALKAWAAAHAHNVKHGLPPPTVGS